MKIALLLGLFNFVFGHSGHDHDHDHDHGDDDGATHVLHLNEDNFDSTVASHPLVLVEFFAPWCGHCKKLAPEYESAASTLYGKIPLASVDCTLEKDLCTKWGVQGFPTLKTFRNDKSAPVDYQGGRTADEIVKYMTKQGEPAYKTVDTAEALESAKSAVERALVVGFFPDDQAADFAGFKGAANTLRNDLDFAHVASSALSGEAGTVPSVVIYRKFDDPKVTYNGPFTSDALVKWIKGESFPSFGEIGPENYQKYVERDLPFLWAFLDYEAGTESIIETVTPVAKQFKQLSFVRLDGVKWASHAKNYGIGKQLPGIVIEDRNNRRNYLFPEDRQLTSAALTEWVQSYVDGKLQANLKSQEEPSSQDEAVFVLVGKTFDQYVNDDTKDVLVEFYAPWCGHCKNLAPKYEELAKDFQDYPSVLIAKIDSTENDTPADIKGFPTLLFYPSGAKSKPLTYKGERSKQAMSDWLWENAPTLKTSSKTASIKHEDL